jgi:hypothetical protein
MSNHIVPLLDRLGRLSAAFKVDHEEAVLMQDYFLSECDDKVRMATLILEMCEKRLDAESE